MSPDDLPRPQDADASEPVVDPDTIGAKPPTGDAESAPADAAPDDDDTPDTD